MSCRHLTLALLITLLTIISGCKEFRDDEFLEDQTNQNSTEDEDGIFKSSLTSTDTALTDFKGTFKVQLKDDNVSVTVSLQGVPGYLNNVTYAITSLSCSSFITTLTAPTSTKTASFSEDVSLTTFQEKLTAGGLSSSFSDLGRGNVIIKMTRVTLPGSPEASFNVMCGDLVESAQ